MGFTAQVVIDGATVQFDKPYTYRVPEQLFKQAVPGVRVLVPFGRANQKKQGIILRTAEAPAERLKSLLSVIDEAPVISAELLSLCEYMREQTFCTYFDAIHAILPSGINTRLTQGYRVSEKLPENPLTGEEQAIYGFCRKNGEFISRDKLLRRFDLTDDCLLEKLCEDGLLIRESNAIRKMNDATMKMVRLLADPADLDAVCLTQKQREVVDLLIRLSDLSVKEIVYYLGITVSVIAGLEKKRIVQTYDREFYRAVTSFAPVKERPPLVLSEEQQAVYETLLQKLSIPGGACHLLYGVTGSGKTQVFLKLVDAVIDRGLGVIIMVPEISLTPQTLRIFGNRYGNRVAVFHSGMSLGQRMDEWKRVRDKQASIAIGTRSAVFAPFEHIGLIVMDEEQEHTYKSEQSPRFHARNLAKFRANRNNCLLLLASATPSIESFAAAKSGKYGLSVLKHRYGGATLPEVITVDMKAEILSGNSGALSRRLFQELETVLKEKKQAILLLNRRGHNTYVTCPSCGYVASCPNCSISLTYHSANRRMMCHYCGYSVPVSTRCPECGNEHIRFYGMGTQKVEEELKTLFPSARVLRMDADSTMARNAFHEYLNRFSAGEYDFMLGTQMVAKGLNFPKVTLVGVLGADQAMYSADYRSFERTFSLLTQVVGRAGRGEFAGKALIQTTSPESILIHLAVAQDYDTFYEQEILTRKVMVYPPYCDLALVSVGSLQRELANGVIQKVFETVKQLTQNEYRDVKLVILGPCAASVPKINQRYRFRMIIKCKNTARFREMLRKSIQLRLPEDTYLTVDMNPESVL